MSRRFLVTYQVRDDPGPLTAPVQTAEVTAIDRQAALASVLADLTELDAYIVLHGVREVGENDGPS